jgi:hypothetical protein
MTDAGRQLKVVGCAGASRDVLESFLAPVPVHYMSVFPRVYHTGLEHMGSTSGTTADAEASEASVMY